MLRFFLYFFTIQAVLFTLELWQPVRERMIEPFTTALAFISAWIVGIFDKGVESSGIVLYHIPSNFAVSIEAGCNGVEAMIILAAAILAFPASWKHKLIGLGLGFVVIQSLNLVRIISLFYVGQWSYAVFEWTHLYLWQALIMLDALIFWLVWIRMLPRKEEAQNLLAGISSIKEPKDRQHRSKTRPKKQRPKRK